jgi:integrase
LDVANTLTKPGQYGTVSYKTRADGKVRARARLALPDRDGPGEDIGGWRDALKGLVPVEGVGATETAALEALESAVRRRLVRHAEEHSQVTAKPRTVGTRLTLAELAAQVIDRREALSQRDPQHPEALRRTSAYVYKRDIEGHLNASALGKHRIGQVGRRQIIDYLRALPPTIARRQRSVLNETYREAIRRGFVAATPMPTAAELRLTTKSRKQSHLDRNLTLDPRQVADLLAKVRSDERAKRLDLIDLLDVELVIGARIGECIGLTYNDLAFTDDGRVLVTIAGTIERIIGGSGDRLVKSPPKTDAGVRVLPCPARIAGLFRARAKRSGVLIDDPESAGVPIFPAPGRWPGAAPRWWDRSNLSGELRHLFDRCGYPWLSFHGLRKTAVSAVADAHGSRVASHWAGHGDPRITESVYLKRSTIPVSVADVFA